MTPTSLTRDEARRYLVGQAGLRQPLVAPDTAAAVRTLIAQRRCIQLDPLDVIGTNADLVAAARIDGLKRGDVYRHLLPTHAFEHYAKEACLLPADAFPAYRVRTRDGVHRRIGDRLRRIPQGVLDEVLAEITERGPSTPGELTDRGRVDALNWSGWKGTGRLTKMAIEVLYLRCRLVVAGRRSDGKVYDLPSRALATGTAAAPKDVARWMLLRRVEAAGLLATAGGPLWGMLRDVRTGDLPAQLVAEGALEAVTVEGSRRVYLAPAGFRDRAFPDDDGRMRILGPLDPVIWDRTLVKHAFGFEYIWEVYKPAAQRRWGWYVCPLLHRGRLVGRFEPKVVDGRLTVANVWREAGETFDEPAFLAALERHEGTL